MRKLNRAFTLTELLVALGVIAILCAILLPVIFNLMPNQNTIMAKRAFYATQTIVADLINDEACYPDKTSYSDARVGFDDGYGYANCSLWGGDENTGTISSEGSPTTKFITLFTDKLGLDVDAVDTEFSTTSDGMTWEFSSANFSSSDDDGGSILLSVDVNGSGNDPNCGTSSMDNAGSDCSSRTSGFDRFQMTIYGNGKIEIADDWAQEAVKVNKDVTEE